VAGDTVSTWGFTFYTGGSLDEPDELPVFLAGGALDGCLSIYNFIYKSII
jgi:hypothetical protein